MFAVLERVTITSPAVRTFWFRPEKPFDFIAGQFTELYLPHDKPDDRGQKRWFTISSIPGKPLFSITVKLAAGRSSSFKQALRQTPLGSRLQFADPMGDFVLPKDKNIPLLYITGGIGITPVHSMVASLQAAGEQRRMTLLHQVSSEKELLFKDIFQKQAGLTYLPIISRIDHLEQTEALRGKVHMALILEHLRALPEALVYISGPELLVEYLARALPEQGVPNYRIVTDFFHGYTAV